MLHEHSPQHSFIRVRTSPVLGIQPDYALEKTPSLTVSSLFNSMALPVVTDDQRYDVFLWHQPHRHAPMREYPMSLRSFQPIPFIDEEERTLAKQLIAKHGPVIPRCRNYYDNIRTNEIEHREQDVVRYEVPLHQARGFHDSGIYAFGSPHGEVIKFTVCTKGNGTCGYWNNRRKNEMLDALDGKIESYPLHPDAFHARDRRGQQVGGKRGDDVVWVGCASDTVTEREVAGFNIYDQCGIFHPMCLPVRRFEELPLSTGEFIPTQKFTDAFDPDAMLVYLAKAWALETRIWGNHFTHEKMTAAHLLSAKETDRYIYEDIVDELRTSAHSRKSHLSQEADWVLKVMSLVDKNDWVKIFGHSGSVLAKSKINLTRDTVIPEILSINMTENVARAGAHRLWGKPVAWHLENVGRLGEVSGGERIYGTAEGTPGAMEIHSLFAYMFDAYSATAIEWASSGRDYIPFGRFFQDIKTRMYQLNPTHWIHCCKNLDQFVSLCQSNYPEYQVSFRSEDAYPLVAVPGSTDPECAFENESGHWKRWDVLERNMIRFMQGIKSSYTASTEDK